MTDLEMPAAYAEYLRDDVLRRVVDDLVPQLGGKHMPVTDREAQRDYHVALGMAATVRAAYAAFLIDAWEAVWGVQDLSGFRYDPDWLYPPAEVWDGEFGRRFVLPAKVGSAKFAALTLWSGDDLLAIGLDLNDEADNTVEAAVLNGASDWKRWHDGDTETCSVIAAEVREANLAAPEALRDWVEAARTAAAAAIAAVRP